MWVLTVPFNSVLYSVFSLILFCRWGHRLAGRGDSVTDFLHRKRENKCFFWLSFNFSGMLASSNIYILSSFCLHPISLRMPKLSTLLIVTFPAYLKFCFFFIQGLHIILHPIHLMRYRNNWPKAPLSVLHVGWRPNHLLSYFQGASNTFHFFISHPHISQIPCMFLLAYLALLFFLHFHWFS